MTHLSLFSGIGGLDLAAEWAGFETVGQVEADNYCSRVLERHFPGVPRWRDVKDVTAESFEEKTGIKPGTLAVLSGGFPLTLDGHSEEYSETWPKAGIVLDGYAMELVMSAHRTKGKECLLWPTPHSTCSTGPGKQGRQGGENLQTAAQGQLNPDWVTLLMGFPPGWLDIDGQEYSAGIRFDSWDASIMFLAELLVVKYAAGGCHYGGSHDLQGIGVKYASDPGWAVKVAGCMKIITEAGQDHPC